MAYDVMRTALPEVLLLQPKVFGDLRGFFFESFNANKGVLRGMHYQIEHPQGKLVRVVHGEVFDVAVDLRRSSPNFGKWFGVILSGENKLQLWIPEGFAHGFLVLSESAEFLYKSTDYWYPEHERSVLWNDPGIGIDWPLHAPPNLAKKDEVGRQISNADVFA